MRNKYRIKNSLILGFAMFAMFFGAGNLIFPPYLGFESGSMWPLGFIGFLVADVVLACVGIYAMNAAGGAIDSVELALSKVPGIVLGVAGVVCLGVIFAMPRTAATTYEMSIVPILGNTVGLFPFSIIFFVVVFLLSIRESRIMDIIGRFFTPTLVIGILVLIVAGIVNPIGEIGAPQTAYVVQDGVRAGYQTMDILGVMAFSIILIDSINAQGVTDRRDVLNIVGLSSIVAVVLLGIIYGGLTFLGATAQSLTVYSQAQLIIAITQNVLGEAGVVILGIVVALACITTAVALVGSTASYFFHLFNGKVNYRLLVVIDCIVGLVICNMGLDAIVQFAEPVLGVICPPFVVLIILFLFQKHIKTYGIYKGAALFACLSSFVIELHSYGGLPMNIEWLPLYDMGFGWVVFAVIGGFLGWVIGRARKRSHLPLSEEIAKNAKEISEFKSC